MKKMDQNPALPGGDDPPDQAISQATPARPVLLTKAQKQERELAITSHRGNRASGVREELEELEEEGFWPLLWRDLLSNYHSILVSLLVHMILVVILILIALPGLPDRVTLTASPPVEEEIEEEDFDPVDFERPEVGEPIPDIVDRDMPDALEPMIDEMAAAEGLNAASVKLIDDSLEQAVFNDILSELGGGSGTLNQPGPGKGNQGNRFGLKGMGRGAGGRGGRRSLADKLGATPESEKAVDLALKWLADHQGADGGWSFAHQQAPLCQGQCGDPGEMVEARIAATALGVLPFLGAGQTHQVGKYQRTVTGGLNFLIGHINVTRFGGSLEEPGGRMYAHGLATIALCEAYAMNLTPAQARRRNRTPYHGEGARSPSEAKKDRLSSNEQAIVNDLSERLGPAAQSTLNYVVFAQDPIGGGWRYSAQKPGDTSVVGWQLMGLMSGKLAYLKVDPQAFIRSATFLEHVKKDDYGSDYGYLDSQRGSPATQAIGLLCRMYLSRMNLGWGKDHPGLIKGIDSLSSRGPLRGKMYYNYYATQVMHHYGGPKWERWNNVMRDSLIASQSHDGHEKGSWHFGGGDHGSSKGGRLYFTALSAMTLEVYYRHMPLYGEDVIAKAAIAKSKQPQN